MFKKVLILITCFFTQFIFAEEFVATFIQQHITQNEALGILDACEKKYQSDQQDGFLNLITSSDRYIYSGVKQNFALCDQKLSNIEEVEIDNLDEFTKNIEKEVAPITILEDLNKSALRQTLRALLFAQIEYSGEIDPKMVEGKTSQSFPSISKNPSMLSILKEEIENFKNIMKPQPKLLNRKIVTQMNSFGTELKTICSKIHEDYESKKNTETLQKQGFHFSKTGRVTPQKVEDKSKTDPYHKENQKKILDVIDKFKLSNHHSQLFSTPSVKEIFSLDSNIGEKCAKGRIKEVFSPITPESLLKSQKEYLKLLQEELHKRDNEVYLVNEGKKDLPCILSPQSYTKGQSTICKKLKVAQQVEEKIKETLKYRPHLIGQLLEDNKDSPWYQNIVAKYTCKYSNEIYQNNDELWNATELAIAGATIIGAIAAAPAIGLVSAGAGLYTLGAIAIGTEGYIAVSRINDANKTQEGIQSGRITNKTTTHFQISEQERADSNKKWAAFDAGMVILGSASIAKGRKVTKIIKAYKKTILPPEVIENELFLNDVVMRMQKMKDDNLQLSDFPRLLEDNNEVIKNYAELLYKRGVRSEIYESDRFPGFYNLKILSVDKNAPKTFKLYVKAAERFDAKELTISIVDNINEGSSGFFNRISQRVDLGYLTLTKSLSNQINTTPNHELRHLLNLKRSRDGDNNIFDGHFNPADGKNLYDERPKGLYSGYMSADELYTFASDLWEVSKGGAYAINKNGEQIFDQLSTLKQISDNTTHLSDDFLIALDQNPKVTADFLGTYSILNKEGHSYSIVISNKKMKEIKELASIQPTSYLKLKNTVLKESKLNLLDTNEKLIDHYNKLEHKSFSTKLTSTEKKELSVIDQIISGEKEQVLVRKNSLMKGEMKSRLTDLKSFATIQNAHVRSIQKLINKRLKDVKDRAPKQTDVEFSKELQAELRNLGQNTRWLYKKDKP
jgi:hypothetical protein